MVKRKQHRAFFPTAGSIIHSVLRKHIVGKEYLWSAQALFYRAVCQHVIELHAYDDE
jgi:hypothetical protein